VDDSDRGFGKLEVGIERLDGGIVPGFHIAEEDVGQNGAGKLELTRADALDIDRGHDAAHHQRELAQSELGELFGLHRHVGRREIDAAILDAHGAGKRADRLVIERDTGRRAVEARFGGEEAAIDLGPLVSSRPFGDDGIGEGRAGARDLLVGLRRQNGQGNKSCSAKRGQESHRKLSHRYVQPCFSCTVSNGYGPVVTVA